MHVFFSAATQCFLRFWNEENFYYEEVQKFPDINLNDLKFIEWEETCIFHEIEHSYRRTSILSNVQY